MLEYNTPVLSLYFLFCLFSALRYWLIWIPATSLLSDSSASLTSRRGVLGQGPWVFGLYTADSLVLRVHKHVTGVVCYFGSSRSLLFSLHTVESLVVACIYVHGTRMQVNNLSQDGSGTGYRITIGIYSYWIWYLVPDLVKYYFFWSVVGFHPVIKFFILYPVLCTRLNAISGTGHRILCHIQDWVPDPMFSV